MDDVLVDQAQPSLSSNALPRSSSPPPLPPTMPTGLSATPPKSQSGRGGSSSNLNGSAKPGIAAAIAAFEKNSGDQKGTSQSGLPPLKRSVKSGLNSTPKSSTTPRQFPAAQAVPAGKTGTSSGKVEDSVEAKPGPVPDETVAEDKPSSEPVDQTSAEPPVKDVSPAPPASVAPSADPTKPASAAPKAPGAAGAPGKGAARSSTTAPGGGLNKGAPRASVSSRAPPAKPAAKETDSANPARLRSPPGPKVSSAPRRSSVAVGAKATAHTTSSAKPPPKPAVKAAVPSATAGVRKSTAIGTTGTAGPTGAKPGHLPPNKSSLAPAAIARASNAGTQAVAAELESKLAKSESALAEKSELLKSLESRLEEVTKKAAAEEEQLKSQLQVLTQQLEEIQLNSQNRDSGSDAALEDARAQLKEAENRLSELNETLRSHQADQSRLAAQQVDSLTQVSQLEETINKLNQQIQDVSRDKETAIQELSQQHALDVQRQLDNVRQEFAEEKQTLILRIAEIEERSKHSEEEAGEKFDSTLSAEVAKIRAEISEKHAVELQQLASSHASEVEALNKKHESAIQALRDKLEEDLIQAKHALATSEDAHAEMMSKISQEHDEGLALAVNEAKADAERARQTDLDILKEQHATEIAKLEAELNEIKPLRDSLEAERADFKFQVDQLLAEKKDLDQSLSIQLENLKAEHAGQLAKEYQRAKNELAVTHIEQLQLIRQQAQETTDQLMKSHQAELEALKVSLNSDFTSEKADLSNELSQLKLELSALHSDLAASKSTYQEQLDEISRLNQEVLSLKSSLEEVQASATQQSSDSSELERLKSELQEAQANARSSQEAFLQTQQEQAAQFEHARERHETEVNRHIEEKTSIQEELGRLKGEVVTEKERSQMSHELLEELGRTVEEECSKRAALEAELNSLKSGASNGETDPEAKHLAEQKLIELHRAHNEKIQQLNHENERLRNELKVQQDFSEELEFKVMSYERTIEENDQASGKKEETES